ncbi:MAG TPA: carboxy terminal-processing peptidase [Pirellulaceae bacterium]|nr:carboxy terminal-processing peptidase [Pirellulaceae bacterium]
MVISNRRPSKLSPVRRVLSAWSAAKVMAAGFLASAVLLPLPVAEAKPLEGPRVQDRQIARVVSKMVSDEHLIRGKQPLDDKISTRALEQFVKAFDNRKLYFFQSDIEEFEQYKDKLDDMVRKGDISFAYVLFNRFVKRVDERVANVDELLQEDFDFTQDDVLSTDWDKQPFAKDAAEAKDRWRKQLKYDLLVLKSDTENKKQEDPKVRLARRYHSFAKRMHQTDEDELLEIFLTSVTTSFDPHTTYMSPNSLDNFRILMSLNLDGIGAQLKMEDGYTVIDKIVAGGAAEKQGELKVGDRVVSVGQGEEGEMVDVVDMKLNDVVKLIRGRANSVVRLGVMPEAGGEIKTIKITRAKIELKDSEARGVIFEEGKKPDGSTYKVGVIDLPSFYMDMEAARGGGDFKSTTVDVKKILDDFNRKDVDVLILDLRRNGGGSLTEAINLTGLFIDDGPVVQVKDPDGQVQHYDDLDRGEVWNKPLVVLTSKFSASASEILAGAIQDYHRGLIVGDTSTHGKGTVQSLLDLGPQMFRIANPPNYGALKLTMQQFYRPNGDSTQKRGVLADIVLPSLTDHIADISEADLDYAVDFDKVPAAEFSKYDKVAQNVLTEIKSLSRERTSHSIDFAKLAKNIQRYIDQKTRKEIPLSEEKFLARRAELDSEKEEEKTFEHQEKGSEEVVKRDFYFNEALAVTIDYLRLLNKEKVAGAN